VSKPWKRFLEGCPDLWTELDLRHTRRLMKLDGLAAHLKRCNFKLDKVYIHPNHSTFPAKHLFNLTKACKQLSHLELFSNDDISNSLLRALGEARGIRVLILNGHGIITMRSLIKALTLCPQMEHFECTSEVNPGTRLLEWPSLTALHTFKMRVETEVPYHQTFNMVRCMHLRCLIHPVPLRNTRRSNTACGCVGKCFYLRLQPERGQPCFLLLALLLP
jgi:hypothetical protein